MRVHNNIPHEFSVALSREYVVYALSITCPVEGMLSEHGFEDQLKQLRDEFQTSREEERKEWTLLQRQIDQQMKQNVEFIRMMSDQMGMVMRLFDERWSPDACGIR